MAEQVVKQIKAERTSAGGVYADGEWFNLDKKIYEGKSGKDLFQVGQTYNVVGQPGSKGGFFIKGIELVGGGVVSEAAKSSTTAPQKSSETKQAYKKSPEEVERMLRQGVYQHALVSPLLAPFITTEGDVETVVSRIAEAVIKRIKG